MKNVRLKLRDKAFVFIDWANVYGWKKSLRQEVNPRKLHAYLKGYKKIEEIRLYSGTDKNPKSRNFIKDLKKIGYEVVTKPVKYILTGVFNGQKVYRRKCDFDMEICIDVHQLLEKGIESFIFFTGDGDFEPLYKFLIKKKKQVIVVYASGHIGREVWNIKKGIFKTQINHLGVLKSHPPDKRGA